MAKKSEVGTLFFKPTHGFSVPGKIDEYICLGTIVISEGLAKELFAEEEQGTEEKCKVRNVTVDGKTLTVPC